MNAPPFTPATLAARWECSDQHIRDLVKAKKLHGFRIGNLIRIPAAEVERIESGQPQVNTPAAPETPPPKGGKPPKAKRADALTVV